MATPSRSAGHPAPPASYRAAVLVEHGYHELELWYPVLRFRELGAHVTIIGPSRDETYLSLLGYPVIPDEDLEAAAAARYDLLVVPGGAAARRLSQAGPVRQIIAAHLGSGRILALLGPAADLAALAGDLAGQPPAQVYRCLTPDDLPGLAAELIEALTAAA
jgi:protease I